MAQLLQLPPSYILRPARVADTWAMLMLELGLPSKAIPHTFSERQAQQEILLQPMLILVIVALLVNIGILIYFQFFLSFSLEANRPSFLLHTIFSLIMLSIIAFRFIWKRWLQLGWIVQDREQLVGYAILRRYRRSTVLKRIFVAPKHRRRRIGSYLVEMTIRQSRLPIYCWSTYNCVRFFQRLGFISVPLGQLSLREIIGPILSVLFFTKPLTYRSAHSKVFERSRDRS